MASGIAANSRILGGLWGVAIGDALGVPVEFRSRKEREHDPVTDLRGYGTHHQPPGTWSDDTSLTLCTVDVLLHAGEDYQALAKAFVRWLEAKIWTPHGTVFDVGNATADAIGRLARGVPPLEAGRDDEDSNGNGSLMRILPVAIWFAAQGTVQAIEAAHRFSAMTHRHPRSQIGCAIFCLVARHLLAGADRSSAIDQAWEAASGYYKAAPYASELGTYSRIAPASHFKQLKVREIEGSGYVVHALEASLWCLLTTASFKEAVLSAVNLGDDTDTTGAITGALAGLFHGFEAISSDWRARLARHDDLETLFNAFTTRVSEVRRKS
ncbi:MAG: ADP-ribosylglycohydrolase family protein [Candidatus Binataceae bacterium]